ncbi:MAG TPA: ribonuclease HII [Candidatus Margulisiibacteriota bacterium]|nr:ribonuclease HII [Candidatus Margulisiibacteriota bacterium]
MLYFERKLKKQGFDLIIGIDEAGRGPLAGPVVAAAVALKSTRFKNRIDDSKKLSPRLRGKAFPEIMEKSFFGLGVVDEKVIDRVNILKATRLAMEEAVRSLIAQTPSLKKKRVHIIVDGNMAINTGFPCTPIIKGDARSKSIASASILAKVTRDNLMDLYDRVYPQYGFLKHKGYPTKEHRSIIKKLGLCEIHRKSFCQCLSRV